jgi:hypothetical protein
MPTSATTPPTKMGGVSVAFTYQVGDGLHSAIITATKPAAADPATTATAPANRTPHCRWRPTPAAASQPRSVATGAVSDAAEGGAGRRQARRRGRAVESIARSAPYGLSAPLPRRGHDLDSTDALGSEARAMEGVRTHNA